MKELLFTIGVLVGAATLGCAETTAKDRFLRAPLAERCEAVERAVNLTYGFVNTEPQGWWFEGKCARGYAGGSGKLAVRVQYLRKDGGRDSVFAGRENCGWREMAPYSAEIGKATDGYVVTLLLTGANAGEVIYELAIENVPDEEKGYWVSSACGVLAGRMAKRGRGWVVKRDMIDD